MKCIITFLLLISYLPSSYTKSLKSEAKIEQGLNLIKDFGSTLKKKLSKNMKNNGVDASFLFCHENAEFLKEKWQKKNKTKIGRVTLKPRNAKNIHPLWLKDTLASYSHSSAKNKKMAMHLRYGNNDFVVKPIYMKPVCLKCHGSHIDVSIKKMILKKYPKDKAVDYKNGDFRGLFWVKLNSGNKT